MRHYVSNNLPHGQGLSVSELRWTIHPKSHKGTFSAVTVEFSEMEMVTFGILCSFFSEVTEEIAVVASFHLTRENVVGREDLPPSEKHQDLFALW